MRTTCVLVLGVTAAVVPMTAQQPAAAPGIRAMIEAYQAGDYDRVTADLQTFDDLEEFGKKLNADTWSLRVSRGSAFEPRFVVAAALAFELVAMRIHDEPADAVGLLEAACTLVRLNLDREEAERRWHWAAIALLEGLANGPKLEAHVQHALKRFPDEPAFVMAHAVAAELQTFPDTRRQPLPVRDPDAYDEAVRRLTAAREIDSLRAEASLRLGVLYWRAEDDEQALPLLREAASLANESSLQYMSALFLGRVYDRTGDLARAASAYEAATVVVPRAQTAEIALISALMRQGKRAEAANLAETSLVAGARPEDPWLIYGQGDLRFWPMLSARLREGLRR